MPTVEFRPLGKRIEVLPQTRLLDAARQAGVELDASCGGDGTCGKCLVRVTSGDVDSRSLGTLPDAIPRESPPMDRGHERVAE